MGLVFKKKLEKNPELKKILASINWLVFDRIIQLAVVFLVGTWAIRYLGPERYGVISYSAAFVTLFGFFSRLGLEPVIVKELVNDPSGRGRIIGTAFWLKFSGAILALFLSGISIFFVKGRDGVAITVTLILSATLIFQSFDVIDYWFQSQVSSKYVAYTKISASILIGLLKILLILFGFSIIAFAWVMLMETIIIAIGLVYFYIKKENNKVGWKFDKEILKKFLIGSWPIIFSSLAGYVSQRIDQVMIGNMLGEEALGNYAAAVNLSEVWYFIPAIISGAVFPAILYSKKHSPALYYSRLQSLYGLLIWIAFLIAVPVAFYSDSIVGILYGSRYNVTASVLRVYIWSEVAIFLGVAWNKWLLCEGKQKMILAANVLSLLINVSLNLILIPRYGLYGAAVTTLISYFAGFFIAMFMDRELVLFGRMFFMAIIKGPYDVIYGIKSYLRGA